MTANTVASRKSKGRLLQNLVRDLILESFPHLTENDIRSTIMGCSGVDVQLSESAIKSFGYSVECKNSETTSIWSWWEQTSKNIIKNTNPLLVFKRNRSKPLVVITLDHFMNLVKENHQLKNQINNSNRGE